MYTNSIEYRNFLRHLAKMDSSKYPELDATDDEETMDEFLYDDDSMSNYLDTIYRITKREPLFKNLYNLAAGRMLSTDPEIGLAVMYSYDYLDYFFPFLCQFLREKKYELHREFTVTPEPHDETNTYYRRLIELMMPNPSPTTPSYTNTVFPTQVRKI